MSEFSVKFRGVRGSYTMAKDKFLGYGGNTACVEVNAGNNKIILDAGSGIIELGEEMLQNHIVSSPEASLRTPINTTIFLSHIHQDHIQGLTFFKPAHLTSSKINIFGNTDFECGLTETLSELLFNKTFPLDLGDIAADLNIVDLDTSYAVIFDDNGEYSLVHINDLAICKIAENKLVVTCYKSYSHPQNGVIIYKIEYKGKMLVYATDKEGYVGSDRRLALFARGADLLIHDAQYTTEDYLNPIAPKQGFGHSTFEMALEEAMTSHAKNLAFFHLDPTYDDEKLSSIEALYKEKMPNSFIAKETEEFVLL